MSDNAIEMNTEVYVKGNYKYTIRYGLFVSVEYIGNAIHVSEEPLHTIKGIKINNLSNIFRENKTLISVNMSNWNLDKIESISSMFEDCTNLKNVDFGNGFKILKNAEYTFNKCTNLEVVKGFKNEEYLLECEGIFGSCINMMELDLSNLKTDTDARDMFKPN